MRRATPILLTLVVVSALAAGCGDDDATVGAGDRLDGATTTSAGTAAPTGSADTSGDVPPSRPPETFGTVTVVTPYEPAPEGCVDGRGGDGQTAVTGEEPPPCSAPDDPTAGTVLVEEVPGVQEGDKHSLRVTQGTRILQARADGGYDQATWDDLVEGQLVDVWIDGGVAESYPAQADAAVIVVRA